MIEAMPNDMFKVRIIDDHGNEGRMVLCQLTADMRMRAVRLLPGDSVEVALSPYDQTRGRIAARL